MLSSFSSTLLNLKFAADEPIQGPGIQKGGDVWALVIKSVKPADAGLYMCELNTDPPVRSFHSLRGKYTKVDQVFPRRNFDDLHLAICGDKVVCGTPTLPKLFDYPSQRNRDWIPHNKD